MGWKYETELYMFENSKNYDECWVTGYMGNSLIKAIQSVRRMRRSEPGRAYRLVIR